MRRLALTALAATLLAVTFFVWPTPYRRIPLPPGGGTGEFLELRVHRVTGRVSVLTLQRGWQTLRTPYERAQARVRSEQLERPAPGDSFE